MELKCTVQTYAWGKCGEKSIIAKLKQSTDADFVIDKEKTYAELWMGTHENGPSYLKDKDMPLQTYIQENPDVLGSDVVQMFGTNLPFLFKVLSINKALSIQVHPNKEKAEELHQLYPDVYKDSNHKPEMAIAVSSFEALCGFRPVEEIKEYLEYIPELCAVVGKENAENLSSANLSKANSTPSHHLQQCFYSLMDCDPGKVAKQLQKLIVRLQKTDSHHKQWAHADLLNRLHSDYPGDVGCFTIYLFNYVSLMPGQAMYIGPNVPHAYISGDCVECMACSDNVIRAGLTPKPKDVKTLIEVLSFEQSSVEMINPSWEDNHTQVFRPPVSEFAVARICVPNNSLELSHDISQAYTLRPRNSASILLIVHGGIKTKTSNKIFSEGSVLFIPANNEVDIDILSNPTLMFQAFSNV